MIYRAILKIRDCRYRAGSKKVQKASVPTVCVGNITVGGTGKTPHTELILRLLLESDEWGGRNIAVLSRGYKRRSKGFQQVLPDSTAALAGDEPLQIKKKFPVVTVAVDKDRIEGCRLLTEDAASQNLQPSDVIVLDDAYQYRKLSADFNIVLVDWNRPLWKDSLLPLGRLRDLPSRALEADLIIVSKCPAYIEDPDRSAFAAGLGFTAYDPANFTGTTKDGRRIPVLFSTVRYAHSEPVFPTTDTRYIYSKKVVAFTGIAKNAPFLQYLSDSYRIVREFSFPDHHRYRAADFGKIRLAVKQHPTAAVATTEKDAQRVLDFGGVPDVLRERMIYVPIEAAFLTEEELETFRSALLSALGGAGD